MLIVCICGNNFARLPLGSRLAGGEAPHERSGAERSGA